MTQATVTAKLPAAAPTTTDIPYAGNDGGSPLTSDVTDVATSFPVQDLTNYPAVPFVVRIGNERILITGKSASTGAGNLTTTLGNRGFDSSVAAAHKSGARVMLALVAYLPNRYQAELIAIGQMLTGALSFLHGLTVEATASAEVALTLVQHDESSATRIASLKREAAGVTMEVFGVDLGGGILVGGAQLFESDRDLAVTLLPNADGTLNLGSAARHFGAAYLTSDLYMGAANDLRLGRVAETSVVTWNAYGSPLVNHEPKGMATVIVYKAGGVTYARTSSAVLVSSSATDTTVAQAAIDYVGAAGGGVVHFKLGTFNVQNLVVNRYYVEIEGEGWGTILAQAAINTDVLRYEPDTTQASDLSHTIVRDLTIQGLGSTGASGTGRAITNMHATGFAAGTAAGWNRARLERVQVTGFSVGANAVEIRNPDNQFIIDHVTWTSVEGVKLYAESNGRSAGDMFIRNCEFLFGGAVNIYLRNTLTNFRRFYISGNTFLTTAGNVQHILAENFSGGLMGEFEIMWNSFDLGSNAGSGKFCIDMGGTPIASGGANAASFTAGGYIHHNQFFLRATAANVQAGSVGVNLRAMSRRFFVEDNEFEAVAGSGIYATVDASTSNEGNWIGTNTYRNWDYDYHLSTSAATKNAHFRYPSYGNDQDRNPQVTTLPIETSLTGTVTATNGSPNVVGAGTSFTTELKLGQTIRFDSDATFYYVGTITDDLNISLVANTGSVANYTGTTGAGKTAKTFRGALRAGAGGRASLDTYWQRRSDSLWEITGALAGSARLGMLSAANAALGLRAAATDANPYLRASNAGLELGAGGTSAMDVQVFRGAADRLDLASGDSLNLVLGALLIGGVTLFESDRDVAVSLLPNADATLDLGSAARNWKNAYIQTLTINNQGAGGDPVLSANSSGQLLDIDASITPLTDGAWNVGNNMKSWNSYNAKTNGYRVWNASGDTFASTVLGSGVGGLSMGAGGASDQDVRLRRNAANSFAVDDPTGTLAGDARTVILATGNPAFAVRSAAANAQPEYRMSVTGGIEFGAGGATAPSAALVFGAADRIDVATGDSLNIVLGNFQMGATTLFESDRDLAVTLLPNADASLNLGSAARQFAAAWLSGTLTLGGDVGISRGAADRLDLATGDSLNIVSGNLQIGATTVFESDRDVAVNLTPNADNSLTNGTTARRWATVESVLVNVRAAASDTNPTAQLSTTGAKFGVSSADALSVSIFAGAADRLDLASGDSLNLVLGNFLIGGTILFESDRDLAVSLVPNADNSLTSGTSARRWSSVNTAALNVYAAASDANASHALTATSAQWGAGGASALDSYLTRTGAKTLVFQDAASAFLVDVGAGTFRIKNTSTGSDVTLTNTGASGTTAILGGSLVTSSTSFSLGSAASRWASVATTNTGYRVFATASDANVVAGLSSSGLTLGAGGATAVDVTLARGAANRLDLTASTGFNVSDGSLLIGGTILFENDRDLAVSLLPNADNSLNLGSSTRTWAQAWIRTLKSDSTGMTIGGATSEKLGFYGASPVVRDATAFTQTYATASHTHAADTASDMATTAATQTVPWGFASQAQADAIGTKFNALRVDVDNIKQFVNALVDTLQSYGLVG